MDHSYYRDKISAFVDGALEAQEQELIRRHLGGCDECQRSAERLVHLGKTIEELSGLKGNEYFKKLASKIENRIAQPKEKIIDIRKTSWTSLWWKISAAAASILLVGTIGYYQWQGKHETPSKVNTELNMPQSKESARNDSEASGIIPEASQGPSGKSDVGSTGQVGGRLSTDELKISPALQDKEKRSTSVLNEFKDTRKENIPMTAPKPAETNTESENLDAAAKKVQEEAAGQKSESDKSAALTKSEFSNNAVGGEQFSLGQWRSQRDSIENSLGFQTDTSKDADSKQIRKFSEPAVNRLAQNADSIKTYQALANSWYQIALQTQDGKEKNRAIQFLNWYKARFPTDSPAVNQQLQQVPK